MSGYRMLSLSFTLALLCPASGTPSTRALTLQSGLELGPVSLNDMFREVEELMEDTQHILKEAVDQVCIKFEQLLQLHNVIYLLHIYLV